MCSKMTIVTAKEHLKTKTLKRYWKTEIEGADEIW